MHGGHVLLGALLVLLYGVQAHTYGLYSAAATDSVHGVLGIVLYWHFVDAVWLSVAAIVYGGQLAMHDTTTAYRPMLGLYAD